MSPARSKTIVRLVLMITLHPPASRRSRGPGDEVDDAHAVDAHDYRVDLDKTHVLGHRGEQRRGERADLPEVIAPAPAVAIQEPAHRRVAEHLLASAGGAAPPPDRPPPPPLRGPGAGGPQKKRARI